MRGTASAHRMRFTTLHILAWGTIATSVSSALWLAQTQPLETGRPWHHRPHVRIGGTASAAPVQPVEDAADARRLTMRYEARAVQNAAPQR